MAAEQDNTEAIIDSDDCDEGLKQNEGENEASNPEASGGKAAAKAAQKKKDEGPGYYGWGSVYGQLNGISWKLHL
jgi:hypothetical protein